MSSPNRPPPLAAIVPAYDAAAALQPIAGATLLERQLRALAAAGTTHAVLLIDELPAEMAAIVGELRGHAMRIDLVRTLEEGAERIGAAVPTLLLAEGCVADPALLERTALGSVPAVATLDDAAGLECYERIDATTRWAGIALVNGARVAETAAMLGEWDPASTLLRRAVQEGARRVAAEAPPLLSGDAVAVADAERRLLAGARRGRRGWVRRRIEGPLADRVLPLLLARGVTRGAAGIAAATLAAAGGILALVGWRWPALGLLLLSGPAAANASQLYALHGDREGGRALRRIARLGGLGLALAGFAWSLWRQDGQWGWLLVAAAVAAALGALERVRRFARHYKLALDLPWLAGAGAMPWVLAPFALVGLWRTGAAALLAYALASLVAAAWRLEQRLNDASRP